MARPSNTVQRRAQITRGLIQVMAKQGYDGASVADIARAARLTPGLVHYHFESKREILLAALRDLVAQHERALDLRLANAAGDPIAEARAFIELHLATGRDADPEALACWILLSGEALREEVVRVEFERELASLRDRLASIIRRGVERQLFSAILAGSGVDAAATALVAAIQGYYVLAATARELVPRGSAAPCVKSMAEGLLRPARPLLAEEVPS